MNGRPARADDYRHLALGDTVSTNSDCLDKARTGDPGLLWITARRQLGGRGRRGRAWVSEPGNLYASLLLIDPAPVADLPSLPLAAAVAVRAAIAASLPGGSPPVEVKWPNDVMIGRRKTCGILVETERLPDGRQAVVIGIGINIAHRPDEALYPVTSLAEVGSTLSVDEVFAHLFGEMARIIGIWDRGQGIASVVAEWRAHAMGMGELITVNLPDRSLPGIFDGIEDDGLLRLRDAQGVVHRIAAGDVFFKI